MFLLQRPRGDAPPMSTMQPLAGNRVVVCEWRGGGQSPVVAIFSQAQKLSLQAEEEEEEGEKEGEEEVWRSKPLC
jgi:hypothetical protein